MTRLPPSPFVDPDRRFILDEPSFMLAILPAAQPANFRRYMDLLDAAIDPRYPTFGDTEPAPLFLRDSSPDFMAAAQIMPIVEILAGHAA